MGVAAFLKLDFQCEFLQVILAPKGTKSLTEGRQEGKSAPGRDVCSSVEGGWEKNDVGCGAVSGLPLGGSLLAASVLLSVSCRAPQNLLPAASGRWAGLLRSLVTDSFLSVYVNCFLGEP